MDKKIQIGIMKIEVDEVFAGLFHDIKQVVAPLPEESKKEIATSIICAREAIKSLLEEKMEIKK